MINLPLSDVRIFLCATPIKMCYGIDTLMGLAQTVFDQDPLSGHLFLFFNRERNRVKILFWDQDGFCIWYKRLERGTFPIPEAICEEQGVELDYAQLVAVARGFGSANGTPAARRYRRVG